MMKKSRNSLNLIAAAARWSMRYNPYDKVIRAIEHNNRLLNFLPRGLVLDPDKVVNRALYGTDYDPDEVRFFMGVKYDQSSFTESVTY